MSLFTVLERFGTWALLRFTGALVLFVLVHLLRIPIVLMARVLEVALHRIDRYVAQQVSKPPTHPVNQFFPTETPEEAAHHVFA